MSWVAWRIQRVLSREMTYNGGTSSKDLLAEVVSSNRATNRSVIKLTGVMEAETREQQAHRFWVAQQLERMNKENENG